MKRLITHIDNGCEIIEEYEFTTYKEAREELNESQLKIQTKNIINQQLDALEYLQTIGIDKLKLVKNEKNELIIIFPSGKTVTIEIKELL